MADLVSPVVNIISHLWPCCARHTRYLCKLPENRILLGKAMVELKEMRDDVQRTVIEAEADPNDPKRRTDQVRGWLQSVEIIESEVEEILETIDEQLSRGRCLGGCCPPNKCWKNYKLGKLVVMKMASLNDLKGKGHFQDVTYQLPPPSVQELNLESTVGMESMFDKVWKLITNKDNKVVRIMGLYGKGGVGKTTLLEKINDEFKKTNSEYGFDHVVIFVVVSKPINYVMIQNKIGERLGLSDSLKGDEDASSRSDKIFNILRNKNFVILLDDIWERVDLRRIGIPSPLAQCNSSKVIFTTRNKQVCGLMEATHTFQVECLPWDKAWYLFQNKVGEDTLTSFPRARELAEHVAKECGGLPLALITIGRAMSTKKSVEEWKNAIATLKKAASEFEGMSDEVLPRLKLSYDYLRDETMKSCFLYCALFPEDHSIFISRLIDYWIGEGYLNRFDKLDEARSHGHHVIETLKRACLLECGKFEQYQVKMHDIIRDLALWIVNDCNKTTNKFLVTSNICEKCRNAERIFWTSIDVSVMSREPPILPNLRTLIVHRAPLFWPQSFFQFMPSLRVIDFSHSGVRELPTSICQLSELQYLGLSRTGILELPVELRKLVKLKFLDLSCTGFLKKIPIGMIATFSELQVLDLSYSGFKDWEINEEDGSGLSFCELDRLKQLEDLGITINTSLALDKLLCNQKLRTICTDLNLKNCINLKSISLSPSSSRIVKLKRLENLTSLKHLTIQDCEELEELILFDMSTTGGTNNKLEFLCLYKLPRLNNIVWGEKYHHYLHEYSPFQNLTIIKILNCNALKDLTWLVYLENLKVLYVEHCDRLETIIELDDDGLEGARGGRVFGRLKALYIHDLPELKSICKHALAFPSIEKISINYCLKLKKLPLDSSSNINNTLKEIEASEELWNGLEWEEEIIKSKFLPYYREFLQ